MIRKMTQTDYQKIFDLWKSTDRMGLRSLDDSQQGIANKISRNCYLRTTKRKNHTSLLECYGNK